MSILYYKSVKNVRALRYCLGLPGGHAKLYSRTLEIFLIHYSWRTSPPNLLNMNYLGGLHYVNPTFEMNEEDLRSETLIKTSTFVRKFTGLPINLLYLIPFPITNLKEIYARDLKNVGP